jgi:hypothetical protein
MIHLKGTFEELEAYNAEVTIGEEYQGVTSIWAIPIEIDGEHYIAFNEKYESLLEKVEL